MYLGIDKRTSLSQKIRQTRPFIIILFCHYYGMQLVSANVQFINTKLTMMWIEVAHRSSVIRYVPLPLKTERAVVPGTVGKLVGKRALEAGITSIVFDRGGRIYHGRVQALADGAREAGLQF